MVTSAQNVSTEIPSDKVQQTELSDSVLNKELAEVQRRNLSTGLPLSKSSQDGSEEQVSSNSLLVKDPETKNHLSQSSQGRIWQEVNNLDQRTISESGLHSLRESNQEGETVCVNTDNKPDYVQERQSLDTGFSSLKASMVVEQVSSNSLLVKDPETENHLSQFSQDRIWQEVNNLDQSAINESGLHSLQESNQEGDTVRVKPDNEPEYLQERQSLDTGISSLNSSMEGKVIPIIPEKVSYTLHKTHDGSQPYQKKLTVSVRLRPEKELDKLLPRRNPDGVQAVQSDQGVYSSRVPEKPSEDGYNWRKYGQKFVRGNTFIRSYYKCTFANCPARKQVERSHDGPITEINYLWEHGHPKPTNAHLKGTAFPMPIQARRVDEPCSTTSEDKSSVHGETSHCTETTVTPQLASVPASSQIGQEVTVSQSSEIKREVNDDGDPDSKRQKRDVSIVGTVIKTSCEPRVVVQTTSVVDIVNDGYRWRKYGQKLVKGNSNPRSYYRCTTTGCPAKKHVERAAHDPGVVLTTYEGRHDHDIPAGRTVTHNPAGGADDSTTKAGEPRANPESKEAVGMEMVVHVGAN